MEAFIKRPIAHRGLHNYKDVVENTIESFELAIKNDFLIELDIVLSKDKEVMVFHDYNLNRLAGLNKLIKDCTANELRNIKLLETNSVISSIDEVLYKINGKVPILIEIKKNFHPDIEERLFEIIRSYEGEIAIQSFDNRSIIWFKNNAPFYKLGLISNDPGLTVEEIRKLGVDFLAFDINILDSDINNSEFNFNDELIYESNSATDGSKLFSLEMIFPNTTNWCFNNNVSQNLNCAHCGQSLVIRKSIIEEDNNRYFVDCDSKSRHGGEEIRSGVCITGTRNSNGWIGWVEDISNHRGSV